MLTDTKQEQRLLKISIYVTLLISFASIAFGLAISVVLAAGCGFGRGLR